MKSRLFLAILFFALVAGLTARADTKQPPTPLEKQMKIMSKALKQLKAQAGDATKNVSSAALVQQMETAATTAESLTPAKASTLPADQQPKFVADYKASMQKLEASLAKLSAAFKANDNAAAAKILADIQSQERAGHKEFRPARD